MYKRKIILISVLIILSLILVFDLIYNRYIDTPKIKIADIKILKITKSKLHFVFENPYHERLMELRTREDIDEVVKTAKNDFEKIILLRDWTRKQWEPKNAPFPYPPWDALIILDWIRMGKTGGLCAQYAVVFAQALMSLEIPVRYLDIADRDGNGHFLTEVWSRDFNKWIVMDPYFDIHFEKNNTPLNALELHNAECSGDYENIQVVKGWYVNDKTYDKIELIKLYHYFRIPQRNNQLSNPIAILVMGNQSTIIDNLLEWKDNYIKSHIGKGYNLSSDSNDFYWEPNIITIKVKDKNNRKGEITLEFDRILTKEETFLVHRDGDPGWIKMPNLIIWKLDKGYNKLYVSPEKITLDEGYIQSYIAVQY